MKMGRRSSSITKMAAILLLILTLVTITGVFTYKQFTEIIAGISEEVRPDYGLLTAEELRNNISSAEISVKSYSITRDSSYLENFQFAVERTDEKLHEMEETLDQTSLTQSNFDSLEMLVEQKVNILGELLVLADKFRVDEALSKVAVNIEETIDNNIETGSEKSDTTRNKKFFKWLINRKNKKNRDDKSQVMLTLEQLEDQILGIQEEEKFIEQTIKDKEFELMLKDQVVSAKIVALLDKLRESEMQTIAIKTAEAERTVERTNRQIAIFFIAIGILILFMAYFFMNYVRNSRKYRVALRNAKDEAEALAKSKQRFLANMSHEFRTPLNAIYGFTEQLAKGDLTREQEEQIAIVRKSTDHLLHLINETLDFTKLQAKEIKLEHIGFKPREVFEDVAALMSASAGEKGLHLTTEIYDDVPEFLQGDSYRLKQIFLNLVSNAIKFTETGGITLKMDAYDIEEQHCWIKFQVMDTGIGMTKQQMGRVFEEFEQAELGTSRNYGGTGLGLSIVHMLVDLNRGRIELESEPRIGTTVTVHLPFDITSSRNVREELAPDELLYEAELEKLNIMVVDDEPFNRMLLTNILKNWNCKYVEARDGNEAIDLASAHKFDIILMDTRMPHVSGTEASVAIRSMGLKSSSARIIALTAAVSIEDRMKYKDAGMDGFLSKPFSEAGLLKEVSRVIIKKEPAPTDETANAKKTGVNHLGSEKANFEHLREVCDGNVAFYIDMLQTFIEGTRNGLEMITIAMEAEDYLMVAEQAHKIAAPCAHIGANVLHDQLRRIEHMCRNSVSKNKLESLIHSTQIGAEKIIEQVKAEIEAGKKQ